MFFCLTLHEKIFDDFSRNRDFYCRIDFLGRSLARQPGYVTQGNDSRLELVALEVQIVLNLSQDACKDGVRFLRFYALYADDRLLGLLRGSALGQYLSYHYSLL